MEESQLMFWYPNDILLPQNEYRSIKLLVKEQKSFKGAVDELKKQLEKTEGELKKLYDEITNSEAPVDSKENGAKERTRKLVNAQTICGFCLPLPNELNDSQNHGWELNKGIISTAADELIFEKIPGANRAAKIASEAAIATGVRKPIIDPGYFQEYTGSEPREFTFSWDFVPNNAFEANMIINIILNLKKYTLPTSAITGVVQLSPYLFEINIGNPYINNLMNMNNVVCRSMNVNYSADNSLQFFADGIPKYIRMEMSFIERSLVPSEFYSPL